MAAHCQICSREIKATTGVIAHHGFERPGMGWQTSSCFGARYKPYEQDRSAIPLCMQSIRDATAFTKKRLEDLIANPPESMTEPLTMFSLAERQTFERPDGFVAAKSLEDPAYHLGYDYLYRKQVAELRFQIKNNDEFLIQLQARYDSWAPSPELTSSSATSHVDIQPEHVSPAPPRP
jgi:hypothetical protein